MQVLDTNVLVYAVDRESEFHSPCAKFIEESRRDPVPSFITWSICYEFFRVSTHPRVLKSPLNAEQAWRFLQALLDSPGFSILTPTERHASVLSQTLSELPDLRGNIAHDLHTAVVMRENGLSRICTRDAEFHRFPFLSVIDPIHPS